MTIDQKANEIIEETGPIKVKWLICFLKKLNANAEVLGELNKGFLCIKDPDKQDNDEICLSGTLTKFPALGITYKFDEEQKSIKEKDKRFVRVKHLIRMLNAMNPENELLWPLDTEYLSFKDEEENLITEVDITLRHEDFIKRFGITEEYNPIKKNPSEGINKTKLRVWYGLRT